MISKRIQPSAWFHDEPLSQLLRIHERGNESMDKLAAAESPLAHVEIKPEKGYAFVHLITTGAGERYGSNANSDYFPKQACLWKFPRPLSPTRTEEMLGGGLVEYHKTFMKYGAVYREHNNSKKGAEPQGVIVAEAYNPHMDRGELIVKLGEDKWAADLSDMAEGKPMLWSMGCYLKGALVQMADGGLKEIQDIRPDDRVFTHTGTQTLVTGFRRLRKDAEDIYTVRASGHLDIHCTGNHEQYVIRREDSLSPHGYFKEGLTKDSAQWVRTDDLRAGDWMMCPIPKEGGAPSNKDFALLAGWYVAEGDLKYDARTNSKAVRYSTGMCDDLYLQIDDICARLGTKNKPRVYAEPDIGRRSVYVTDPDLYDNLKAFGRGAHSKRVAPEVFSWDKEGILTFLSGYLSGDGCFYKAKSNKKKMNMYASTASRELALQIQQLGLMLGGFVAVSKATHYSSKSANTKLGYTISYQMRFDAELTNILAPYVGKITDVPVVTNHGKTTRRFIDGYALYKISKISVKTQDVDVFNLHVESDDHSYIVNGLATHNCGVSYDVCSICGNHAKTRSNYCQDLKYHKLAMDKEGNQAFAINDRPHFHDISKVIKPADRIAFSLAKVASAGCVSDDEEDLSNLWLPMNVIEKISGETEQKRAHLLDKLSAIEKRIMLTGMSPEEATLANSYEDMSDEESKTLTDKLAAYPIGSVLNCLNNYKVMLPPRTFACILLKKQASEVPGLGDMPKALRNVFSELKEAGDIEILQDGTYSNSFRGVGPTYEINQIAGRFSLDNSAVDRRVIRSAVAGIDKTACLATEVSAESRYLAKEYAKYQLSFLAGAGLDKSACHLIVLHNQVAT